MKKQPMLWLKHCKKCGKFTSKNGRHDGTHKCANPFPFVSPPQEWGKYLKIGMDQDAKKRWEKAYNLFMGSLEDPMDDLGHPVEPDKYVDTAIQIANLVKEKQLAYGDSFGKSGSIMRTLYPDGIRPEQMDDALTIVRVIDKLFRIATSKDAFGEDPWKDCVGYALLATVRNQK